MTPVGRKRRMAREWTDDEVTKEIRDAVAIVREDRLETFLRGRFGNQSDDKGDSGNAGTDPKSDAGNGNAPKRKSLWWGE
jgi:hypothetical protein